MTIIPSSAGRRTALAVRMIVLLAFAVFFVVPLAWLVLAPTKTDYQLLTESPFAVGSFHNVWIAWAAAERVQQSHLPALDGELAPLFAERHRDNARDRDPRRIRAGFRQASGGAS